MTLRESGKMGPARKAGGDPATQACWAQAQALRFLCYHTPLCSSTSPVTIARLRTFTLSEIHIVHGQLTNILGIHFSLVSSAVVTTQPSEIL